MVCGTPVIAADTGGLREIVQHGETGLRVPPNDPRALAGAVPQLTLNRSQMSTLGAAGQQCALTAYRWADVAQRTRTVYQRVLSGHAA